MTAIELFLRSPFVTRGQAALLLEVSHQQIARLCESGRLVSVSPASGGSFVLTDSILQHHQRRLRRLKKITRAKTSR